jgi:2-keto-4-pentenoate hydratase/2-oxohepta-3-ene-1,7-dioic acid hydratase in catechol pathway
MKYATFSLSNDPAPRLGVVRNDRILDVRDAFTGRWPGEVPDTLIALIQQGPDAWHRLRELCGQSQSGRASHALSAVRWHAPIPRPPKNVVCLGMNYVAHIKEGAAARGREVRIPKLPVFFTKAPTSVTGPYDEIPIDDTVTKEVDWEVELGAIIGISGRDISRDDALRHVFGYTIINDVSARELQMQHIQFFKGKSLDAFCPMGPIVVTADEFGDPHEKRLLTRVNGVVKQDGTTSDMLFRIDAIIESLSKGLTVEAGDIIATGTPEGVGFSRTPPEYLHPGDVLESEIEGIGVMRNAVVAFAPAMVGENTTVT